MCYYLSMKRTVSELNRLAVCFLLAAVLITGLPFCPTSTGAAFAAEYSAMEPFYMMIYAGKADGTVARAYDSNYPYNVYISLTDLSAALDGTSKCFSFSYARNDSEGEHYLIRTGEGYIAPEKPAEERTETVWLEFRRNRLFFDGEDRKYYTYRDADNELYMNLTDIELMFDITAEYQADNCIRIYPDMPFCPDLQTLSAGGYFDYINGVVLGDADTGRILFFKDKNKVVPIASTSKLMTYLLLAEARDSGRISFDADVTVTENAERLSRSADGIIRLEAGKEIPVSELLDAMLLASSNESALALAEYAYGSEAAFVSAMNSRAEELHLNSAEFFNPHGLPLYLRSSVRTKIQNRMNAEDLFVLASYVLKSHPEITGITSKQYAQMPSLEYATANSNPLVFNMHGVTGLKTGSTNKAGYCLAASMPVTSGSETHDIVLVLLGSETATERGQQAEILLRAAEKYYRENGF